MNYYAQFDSEDTDSWLGKDYIQENEENEPRYYYEPKKEEDIQISEMDLYGLDWSMFF